MKKCKDCAIGCYCSFTGDVILSFESEVVDGNYKEYETIFDFCPNCGHKNTKKEKTA